MIYLGLLVKTVKGSVSTGGCLSEEEVPKFWDFTYKFAPRALARPRGIGQSYVASPKILGPENEGA
jgi:hypothetical protein